MLDTPLAAKRPVPPSSSTCEAPQGGASGTSVDHTCDADCRPHLDAEGIECLVCGVSWAEYACGECGGHAFHAEGCVEVLCDCAGCAEAL